MSEAISRVKEGKHDPWLAHKRVREFYNWQQVSERTEKVYKFAMNAEQPDLWARIKKTYALGKFAGPIYVVILVVDIFFFAILEWLIPREDIDYVPKEFDWTQRGFEEFANQVQRECGP